MMAVRLARAFTGRSKLIRLRGHFHGWNDHMTSGYANHFDGTPSTGIVGQVAENVLLSDPNDIEGLRSLIENSSDIAAAILEPTGSGFGQVPLTPEYVRDLRQLTAQHGILLIFDEVVTGFRVSPGGAQRELGVTPGPDDACKDPGGWATRRRGRRARGCARDPRSRSAAQ